MSDIGEDEINYGQVLAHHAYTKIQNEKILYEALEGIRAYNRCEITKNQLSFI